MGKENTLVKLTGLWEDTSNDGKTPYMSGQISPGARLLIFQNGHREKDTDPTHVAYIAPASKREKKEAAAEISAE